MQLNSNLIKNVLELKTPGRALNSSKYSQNETIYLAKPKVKCSASRPCKRMRCSHCITVRRRYFIEEGYYHAKLKKLNTHLVISWTKSDEPWMRLYSNMSKLSRLMSGRNVGAYIRVTSVGPNGCPHVHFLVNGASSKKINSLTKKAWPKKLSDLYEEAISDTETLLGYFFDRNFLPSYNDPNRIKGIRLVSASRPMRCGFPKSNFSKNIKSNELTDN